MITIFTIPKPFVGQVGVIQRNAIKSWLQLKPSCEIILFGDDTGVAEAAQELSVKHVPSMEKNEFGTPLLSSAFNIVEKIAKNNILMYVNTDIIVFQDLIDAIRKIDKPSFLVCGRRWDLNIEEMLDFNDVEWAAKLRSRMLQTGTLHGTGGSDYFIYSKYVINMPPFLVGRQGWDNWLIYQMRMQKIPVVDASGMITVIHQNHDYSHSRDGGKSRVDGPELYYNISITGGFANMFSLTDADWCLTDKGVIRPELIKWIRCIVSGSYIWRMLFAFKMTIYEAIMSYRKRMY